MVALKLEQFGGMIPAVDSRLLPPNNAELSQNTWVYSGALEGLPRMTAVHTMTDPSKKKAFRIPKQKYGKSSIDDSYWLELTAVDTDVIASPAVNDDYERFYWAGLGTVPRYNTKARIATNSASYKLGIPAPTAAPTVSVTGGGTQTETRAYVYTWVSAYGEEGPPSPATLTVGAVTGAWSITTTVPGTSGDERNLAFVNIYRTITGSTGSTTYYYVGQMGIGQTVYVDNSDSVTVSGNNILSSTMWYEPPSDLEGLVTMPNGIVAAWRANEIWFCEPYRPHAWNPSYTLAVDAEIVGLGVFGQSLVVCTTISPYVVSGVNPASMSLSKLATNEPCLSRGSIVSTPTGVVFASPNGLIRCSPGQSNNVTSAMITKNLWLDEKNFLNVSSLRAALLGSQYYCWSIGSSAVFSSAFETTAFQQLDFTSTQVGAAIEVGDSRIAYTRLYSATPTDNCFADVWTGEVFVMRNGVVYWLDLDPSRSKEPYIWRSKILETPTMENFGAMRIWFNTYADSPTLNPVQNTNLVQTLADDQWGLVRFYADDRLVFTRELRKSGELFRLPSGFKAYIWQVEIEARVKVYIIELGESAKELARA